MIAIVQQFLFPHVKILIRLSLSLALLGLLGAWIGVQDAEMNAISSTPPSEILSLEASTPITTSRVPKPLILPSAAPASLHNPGFDNMIWYEFNDRYGTWYARSWVPDDDVRGGSQDWRLWYMRDTPLIQSFPESTIIQAGIESVALRVYDENIHYGGLYQVIHDTTPCMFYNFQIYGRSQPDPGQNPPATLQAGIDRVGWHPNPYIDPAVPGAFPSTTVWGTAHDYKREFGPISVTAEALSDVITVYAYAYTSGGRQHAIVWDSASLQPRTSAVLQAPQNLPSPGGVFSVTVAQGSDAAEIRWHTNVNALGQVYYNLIPENTPPATPDDPYKIFLPLIKGQITIQEWLNFSDITPSANTYHVVPLTNLLRGRNYQFIAVSRGLSNGVCTVWVSTVHTFTTLE